MALLLMLTTDALVNAFPKPQANNAGLPAREAVLARCEEALNCETYTDPSGQFRARFIPGMEPGSQDYERRVVLAKRDSPAGYPKTDVSFGDSTISWGCGVDPVATLANLSSICSEGSCEGDPYDLSITWVTPLSGGMSVATDQKLEVGVTDGHYDTWFRNGLVQAVQLAMSAQGVVTWDRDQAYTHGELTKRDNAPWTDPPKGYRGSCDIATTTSKIGITINSSPDTIEAFIDVTITLPDQKSGLCETAGVFGALGSVAGAFDGAGGAIAAVCGVATSSCS